MNSVKLTLGTAYEEKAQYKTVLVCEGCGDAVADFRGDMPFMLKEFCVFCYDCAKPADSREGAK